MLLALDIGNTQTVIGLFKGDHLKETTRFNTATPVGADDHIRPRVGSADTIGARCRKHPITAAIIASVVPTLTTTWVTYLQDHCDITPHVVTPTDNLPIDLAVNTAETVGADRIANSLAARELYGAPAIVVDFGTATNLDVIDAAGRFIGGPISPGLEIAAQALFDRAARLSDVELKTPPTVLGTDTTSALQSGLLYGEAAKADGLVTRLIAEQSLPPTTPVIATGGLATTLSPLSATITHTDPTLTLQGLRLLATTL